jgi:hypothetical protein
MAKLVGFPNFDYTFTYQKGVKHTSFVDFLLSKNFMDNHYFHKVSHSFPKAVLSEKTSITIGVVWGDFVSLYSQFYEVIILESTYVIGERKMQVYF